MNNCKICGEEINKIIRFFMLGKKDTCSECEIIIDFKKDLAEYRKTQWFNKKEKLVDIYLEEKQSIKGKEECV